MFQQGVDAMLSKLIALQDELFFTKDHNDKEEIKAEIQKIYDDIVMEQIGGDYELREAYFESITETSKPFILWQLYFPRVFKENGGFDIIIGNPPYVDSEEMTKSMPEQRELYASRFTCAKGNWDLYIPFWEKGFNLLNSTGVMSLITPNKWLAIKYGAALRKFLFPYLFNISDYSDFYAFESADVSTVVAMVNKIVCDSICAIKFDVDYSIKSKNEVVKKTIEPFDNISLCLSDNFEVLQKMLDNETLGDLFSISGAATVSETYEIAKYLSNNKSEDVDDSKYLKFDKLFYK